MSEGARACGELVKKIFGDEKKSYSNLKHTEAVICSGFRKLQTFCLE